MATETAEISAETLDSALARAAEAEARGDRRQAVHVLQTEIPEQFANDHVAFVRCGEQLIQLRQFDEAEDVLRRGAEALPHSPWIPRSYALVARGRGDEALALERFTAVRDGFPEFSGIHADLANSLITLGRIDEAEDAASDAVKAFPDDFWIAYVHARAADARDDIIAALARWQALRSKWPGNTLALVSEVRTLARLGRFAEAGDVLASAGDPPAGPDLWREAAELAQQAGAWTFASAWWERFRAARPEDEKGYAGGALALLRGGDAEAARSVLNLGRERWPDSAALAALTAELAADQVEAVAPAEPPPVQPLQAAAPEEPVAVGQPAVPAVAKKPARSRGAFGWLGW